MKKIQVAHSPDADDLFMYYAIKFGWVGNEDLYFENFALDIETLNQEALKNAYEISAISFALYPFIAQEYALLRTGVSFGEGYGPKLIKKKDKTLKSNFKVALSGKYTTNAMLFRIAYPNAKIIYKNFLDIENAVLSGEADAGVLIHESILGFNESLCVEREIWDIWQEMAKDELPLPLGGMAIRRSMPLLRAILCEEILTNAVKIATNHKQILSKMLLERNLIRVDEKKLEIYLNMYANESSVSMNEKQLKAVDLLFKLGYEHKFYNKNLSAGDFLVPREYKEIRQS